MPRAITHCPSCGTTVTPFAAGCAVCGEDLEAARARRAARRRVELPRVGLGPGRRVGLGRATWSTPSFGIDWVHILVAVVLALAISPVGLILAIYWAFQRYRVGNTAMVVAMTGVAGLAIAAMLAPVWFWSHLL